MYLSHRDQTFSSKVDLPKLLDGLQVGKRLRDMASQGLCARVGCPEVVAVSDVIAKWEAEFGITRAQPVGWKVHPRMAASIVRGGWKVEVVSALGRDLKRVRLVHNEPPESVEKPFLRAMATRVHEDAAGGTTAETSAPTHSTVLAPLVAGGPVLTYSAQHVLNAIRATRHLRRQDCLKRTVEDVVQYMGQGEQPTRPVHHPSRHTLVRGRLRLDVTCSLAMRSRNAECSGQRQLCFDKSPLGGGETLVVVEILVDPEARTTVERKLPLIAMGYGHLGIASVTAALLHLAFLEAGPGAQGMRRWFSQVTCITTDQSVEAQVAEQLDGIDAYLKGEKRGPTDVAKVPLFPAALRVMGGNHLVDGILEMCLAADKVDGYPAYLDAARVACRFLRSEHHRQVLVMELEKGGMLSWRRRWRRSAPPLPSGVGGLCRRWRTA
jgi:hypothetical protein